MKLILFKELWIALYFEGISFRECIQMMLLKWNAIELHCLNGVDWWSSDIVSG